MKCGWRKTQPSLKSTIPSSKTQTRLAKNDMSELRVLCAEHKAVDQALEQAVLRDFRPN